MPFRMQSPDVTDRASAEAFVRWCVTEMGLGYHPDTRGADYVDAGGSASFTPAEARRLDRLHERAFELIGGDVYEIGVEEFQKLTAQHRRG